MKLFRLFITAAMVLIACGTAWSQQTSGKRKIIIDQDAAGPGGTDQQSILLLVQSPPVGSVSANRSPRRDRGHRRCVAQGGSGAHPAYAGNHWTHGHSSCAGRRVSTGAAQGGDGT